MAGMANCTVAVCRSLSTLTVGDITHSSAISGSKSTYSSMVGNVEAVFHSPALLFQL